MQRTNKAEALDPDLVQQAAHPPWQPLSSRFCCCLPLWSEL